MFVNMTLANYLNSTKKKPHAQINLDIMQKLLIINVPAAHKTMTNTKHLKLRAFKIVDFGLLILKFLN